jgi:hypothetical protein
MPREPQKDDSIELLRRDLVRITRLALESRAKIAEMQATTDASILETARLLAEADETLARR